MSDVQRQLLEMQARKNLREDTTRFIDRDGNTNYVIRDNGAFNILRAIATPHTFTVRDLVRPMPAMG